MKQLILILATGFITINSYSATNICFTEDYKQKCFDFFEGNSNNPQLIQDSISMDELLNIAVKYFFIRDITPDGYFVGKLCGGINGLKQTEKERNPQVERFCFAAISNNYDGGQFNMYNEFVKGIKELYKINLGIEKQERLLRAQGAMYMFMRNNEKLKDLLLFEYEKEKKHLTFILKIE